MMACVRIAGLAAVHNSPSFSLWARARCYLFCFSIGMTMPYRFLAEYYDQLFQSFRFPIDAAREHVLGSILPNVRSACDLACGTGTTALLLARRGIRVYAVDLSVQMCRLTREKAQQSRLALRMIRADMRSFRLPEPVDLVLCEYDAVNHVPDKVELRKVAKSVWRALRPGGFFCFDVNTSKAFHQYWRGNVWIERPGLAVVMRNGHSDDCDHAWCDIELFVRQGKSWKRQRERVDEVCWTSAEVRETFQDAGFDRLRAWDASTFWKQMRMPRGCRIIYLARKPMK